MGSSFIHSLVPSLRNVRPNLSLRLRFATSQAGGLVFVALYVDQRGPYRMARSLQGFAWVGIQQIDFDTLPQQGLEKLFFFPPILGFLHLEAGQIR